MAESPVQVSSYSKIIEQKIRSLELDVNQLIQNGDADLAVKRVGRGLAIQPRNPLLYQLRGEAYSVLNDFPLAIQNIKKALSLTGPDNARDLKNRLTILHDCYGEVARPHNYELALSNFRKANELSPENKKYRLKCIQCLFAMKRNEECLSMVECELADEDNRTIELLITRAKLYRQFGRVTDCYHDVEAVLDTDGENPIARQLMKELQSQSYIAKIQAISNSLVGKDKESIRKLNISISADPHNPYYHIFRGTAYRRLLLYSSAVDDFLTVMDKCDHQYDSDIYQHASRQLSLTYNEFAMHCFRFGCYGDAVILLNKALKEEKNEHGLYQNRGDCYFKQKQYQFALSDYNQSLVLHNRCIELDYRLCLTHYTLGLIAFDNKDITQSIEQFNNAIQYSPYTARLYMCRARAKYELKDICGAKQDTLRSLLLDTNCEDALPLVARLFPGHTPTQLAFNNESKCLKQSLINDSCITTTLPISTNNNPIITNKESIRINGYVNEIINTLNQCDITTDTTTTTTSDNGSVTILTNNDNHDEPYPLPRSWAVLDIAPIIIIPDNIRAIQQQQQQQQQQEEERLHTLVYYTKKTIKEEIRNMLKSNTVFPPQTKL